MAKTLKYLAVAHDYYCHTSNYNSNEAAQHFNTWAEFYQEFHDSDLDMNLIFRWDIKEKESKGEYYMEVFMMLQRKGMFMPVNISNVFEDDVKTIVAFLQLHYNKLQHLWTPLSNYSNHGLNNSTS